MKEKIYEKDLYKPVKEYFEGMGYTVKSEVKGCDVVAVQDEELVIIELKLSLNLEVILQAIERQKMTEKVYIAVPVPKKYFSKKFKSTCTMLKRLEIGLLLVYIKKDISYVRVEHESKSYNASVITRAGSRKKKRLSEEFNKRHGDNNTGGVNRQKLVTAYREDALLIAGLMKIHGPMSAKRLKALGACDNAYRIVYINFYGWFKKEAKGIYSLTEEGLTETENFSDLINVLMENNAKQ